MRIKPLRANFYDKVAPPDDTAAVPHPSAPSTNATSELTPSDGVTISSSQPNSSTTSNSQTSTGQYTRNDDSPRRRAVEAKVERELLRLRPNVAYVLMLTDTDLLFAEICVLMKIELHICLLSDRDDFQRYVAPFNITSSLYYDLTIALDDMNISIP